VTWTVVLSRQATKDARHLSRAGLKPQAENLLRILAEDPLQSPPRFEKLLGNLSGFYSRRINIQHRLVYSIDTEARVVHVLRMWTHYE
jgi:Txe/YoeB family toxin of toxin-antitoxin system